MCKITVILFLFQKSMLIRIIVVSVTGHSLIRSPLLCVIRISYIITYHSISKGSNFTFSILGKFLYILRLNNSYDIKELAMLLHDMHLISDHWLARWHFTLYMTSILESKLFHVKCPVKRHMIKTTSTNSFGISLFLFN